MDLEQISWTYRAWRYRLVVEREEIRQLLRCLQPGDTVIDIGAHKGGFTYWMQKRVGRTGHVYAFEPQPQLADRLRRMIGPAMESHVTVENMALSSLNGEMVLTVPGNSPSPGASLEPLPSNQHECQYYSVPVRTLDSYFFSRITRRVKLIKCDVEGHEMEVFRGGERILREQQPILIFECECRHRQNRSLDSVFDYLSTLGYTGHFFSNGKLHSIDRFDMARHQADPAQPIYANNFLFAARPVPQFSLSQDASGFANVANQVS
jgi:FkbM family methyltransferase